MSKAPDCANAPVHHVRRCDDVNARLGLAERLLLQNRDRFVIEDVARIVDQTVLPVGRIGIERHVTDHAQLRKALLQLAHSAWHETTRIEGFRAVRGFKRNVDDRKQGDRRDTKSDGLFADRK